MGLISRLIGSSKKSSTNKKTSSRTASSRDDEAAARRVAEEQAAAEEQARRVVEQHRNGAHRSWEEAKQRNAGVDDLVLEEAAAESGIHPKSIDYERELEEQPQPHPDDLR